MNLLVKQKFLLIRRFIQISLIILFGAAHWWGFAPLRGNLSESILFGKIHLADPYAVLQMLATGASIGVDTLIGAGLIALFYALIAGRAFCSYVCPINLVTDAAAAMRRKIKLEEPGIKPTLSKSLRYWILFLGLIVSALTGTGAYELINPVGLISRTLIYGSGFGIGVIGALFLFDFFGVKHGFCGHVCPIGALYALIGRFRLIRVYHNEENCTLCMKCVEICPERHVLHMVGKENGYVTHECTNCGRCVDVCHDNAVYFKGVIR